MTRPLDISHTGTSTGTVTGQRMALRARPSSSSQGGCLLQLARTREGGVITVVCRQAQNDPSRVASTDAHEGAARVQIGGYRAVRRCRTVTVCDETSAPGGHTGCPQAQVSVKQKRHGEHESVTVTIAEEFRSASYDLSIFIRSDVRHSWRVNAQQVVAVCGGACGVAGAVVTGSPSRTRRAILFRCRRRVPRRGLAGRR